MRYISTRDNYISYSFSDILMQGLAPDGGLFMPQDWPAFSKSDWARFKNLSYQELAFEIFSRFVGDELSDADLKDIIARSYKTDNDKTGNGFQSPKITPLHELDHNQYILELFHGPTLAFKDVALQFLGQLFDHHLGQTKQKVTVIGATSGDTGSAAIEGCKDCTYVRVFILHPHGRTSDVQRRQMTTVRADHVHNIALEGSFDDCQDIVKKLFSDKALNAHHSFTAINSINWARIMAQITYYAYSALQLGAPETPVQFVVPTGNFGNIFAAFAAHQLGLPIAKLVIATNENDILENFTRTGCMERTDVQQTLSPSMDIQISSNFERYLFELFNRDENLLNDFMTAFRDEGDAQVTANERTQMQTLFHAVRVDDHDTLETIERVAKDNDYVLDPHSAVGVAAMKRALKDGAIDASLQTVALACAHPSKFPDAVKKATGLHPELPQHLSDLSEREEHYTVLPNDYDAVVSFINKTGM
jgi:threonine synthase